MGCGHSAQTTGVLESIHCSASSCYVTGSKPLAFSEPQEPHSCYYRKRVSLLESQGVCKGKEEERLLR